LKDTDLVDRDAAMPLYHQIFLQLRDEIIAGQHPFGTVLPSEQDLSVKFGVSRITTKRVLDELARQNFVARKRRVGTTVIFHSPVKSIEANIDRALDSLLALGRGTQVRVLEVATETAPLAITNALQLPPKTDIVRAVRVRSLDGMPLGYVLSYVPGSFAPIVTRDALERLPMLEVLSEAGHRPHSGEQRIAATLADVPMAEALEIEPRSALLKISRTVYDEAGVPILLTFAHYRSDRFHVRLDMARL
jgi:GntR family transcriptional regulator